MTKRTLSFRIRKVNFSNGFGSNSCSDSTTPAGGHWQGLWSHRNCGRLVAVWLDSGGDCGIGHWQYRVGSVVGKSPQIAQIKTDKNHLRCYAVRHLQGLEDLVGVVFETNFVQTLQVFKTYKVNCVTPNLICENLSHLWTYSHSIPYNSVRG